MEFHLHRVRELAVASMKTQLQWFKFFWLFYVVYLGMRANATLWNVIVAWCEHGEHDSKRCDIRNQLGVLCARVCWMFLEFFAALWLLLLVYSI